jgi:hypothetical protein
VDGGFADGQEGQKRLGCPTLDILVNGKLVTRHGEVMAYAEALLHEAAHYVAAGGFLTVEHIKANHARYTKACRVTEGMFDRLVSDRLESTSKFVSDAEEMDTTAIVQLAGVSLGLWKIPHLNPAATNIYRQKTVNVQKELRERRDDSGIRHRAEAVVEWWKLCGLPSKASGNVESED